MEFDDQKRREFLKKMAYIAPAILSLQATSAFAKNGSLKPNLPTKVDILIFKDQKEAEKEAEKAEKEAEKAEQTG